MARHRIATAVLLTRSRGSLTEVGCVLRSPALRFFGGYWALPGGVVDPADGDPEEALASVRCGLRELFEETGVLPLELRVALDAGAAEELRRALLGDDAEAARRFRELLDGAPGFAEGVRVLGTLTTPAFAPVRYRTCFLHLEVSSATELDLADATLQGELVDGRFATPERWLEWWRAGEILIAPPVLFLLGELARIPRATFLATIGAEFATLEAGRMHTIRNVPGIVMAPLVTPTLPPATTTNAYVIGEERLYVVDPGPSDPRELMRLEDLLDRRRVEGATLVGILLTHHHPDHVGGAAALARRYDVPVLAHALTLERLALGEAQVVRLEDGARLALGDAPDGSPGWELVARHTPGHAPGHLCFQESRYRSLLAGDLVSTVSTIVIDPADEGHLATYLASLRATLERGLGVLHPAHGPVASDGAAALRRYIEHRALRERALIEALGATAQSVEALTRSVYADVVDERLLPIAARSLTAGLVKLAEEGRAVERDGGWVGA